MATEAEKEELLQTLKFTPVRARLLVQGYGGECYIGSVKRDTYDFFKKKRIDLEQFVSDWDNEFFPDVPDQYRFVEPGSAYDCDDLFHASGASMDSGSYITVRNDETNEDIFETALDYEALSNQGVEVECVEDFESNDLESGSVIFWGGQGEKGCFFDAELTLTKPFDPRSLKLTYSDGDGWPLLTGVEYDGVELEGQDGYSTTGKWAEHKFWIAGNEEVYQGEERGEDYEFEDPPENACSTEFVDLERSDWFDKEIKPSRKGEYEVMQDAAWPNSGMIRAEWTGRFWKDSDGRKVEILSWRGLAQDPALVA
jgi:hypothetical protein